MTESYDPCQNAIAERVTGILKQEFLLQTSKIVVQSAKVYNTKRQHWSCLMLTPEQMHKQCSIKIKSYKKKISEQTMVCSEI